jgi:hypothetical protein
VWRTPTNYAARVAPGDLEAVVSDDFLIRMDIERADAVLGAERWSDDDLAPWCCYCRAQCAADCDCGESAAMHG